MIKISKAETESDYQAIEQLAYVIWRAHYISIVGKPQIDYMLDKFQSAKAIKEQIADGFEYFMLAYNDKPVGYIAIINDGDTLFLSKIYVLSAYRGKKIGKAALQFVEEKAKAANLKSITLTVNKNNQNSIKAYEKLGFENVGPTVKDIGNGFIMDDYKMVKVL
ncbi:GNAT family N-acetyltransferase [Aestuariivivens insulae]|uniref:GNAT family N-acetyltransferase n=1 Tax=Aestuariivivens insulae TaxID=1621988 RepID=UPI001F58415A|nr:GNAT family N-acetyltransferase [Aestuariivivens insulae]